MLVRQIILGPLIVCCVTIGLAQGQTKPARQVRPDLSGTWQLNRAKSDLRDDERYRLTLDEEGVTILNRDPELKLTRLFRSGNIASEERSLFYTDGRGETNADAVNQDAVKSDTKWDGKKLISRYVLRRVVAGSPETVDVIDEWSLSDDGKALTLKTTLRYLLRGTDGAHSAPFKGYVPRLWLTRVY